MTAPDVSFRWHDLMTELGVAKDAAGPALADLCRRYSEPGRFYHTLAHIAHVLAGVERAAHTVSPDVFNAVRLAAWFHDAVYDSRAGDNEERSAEYAQNVLRQFAVPFPLLLSVLPLILATKTHQAPDDDAACRLLLDADLAILGAAGDDYRVYAEAIRREYAWAPEAQYGEGRRGVLERFLQRPRLFLTPPFERLEEPARMNLRSELRQLQS